MRANKLPFEVGENFFLSSSKTKKFKKNIHVIQCTYLSYILKHLVSNGTKYLRMDQAELWKTAFKKFKVIWSTSANHITSNFLKAVFHNFYLVHSGILCLKYP